MAKKTNSISEAIKKNLQSGSENQYGFKPSKKASKFQSVFMPDPKNEESIKEIFQLETKTPKREPTGQGAKGVKVWGPNKNRK